MENIRKSHDIKCVIFDWAGTTVDFGCFAPLNVFVEIFKKRGIEITIDEAREPMGMSKRDHVKAILSMPRISRLWESKHVNPFTEEDIDDLYADFEPALMKILPEYTDVIDGVIPVCEQLRARGIKIGSTTGYTKEMMRIVTEGAARKGYSPDNVVTADDTGHGRPQPYMIFRNMQDLDVFPAKAVVKVGDTVSDIKEGVNAGVWSVGVIIGSSEMGLNQSEYEALFDQEKISLCEDVKKTFIDAGADYVINDMSELPALIDQINKEQKKYLLLTPGPLTTSNTVKQAMLNDWCTWDDDYNAMIQKLRKNLVSLATKNTERYTSVLMQGSGTFSVESVIGTVIPENGKLLVLTNGAYGQRIARIAETLGIDTMTQDSGEMSPINLIKFMDNLDRNPDITHVAVVHCETTTGMLNNIADIGSIVEDYDKVFIVDAMSSFGGIPMDISALNIDYLISSANKCIQGVPGFGFIIANINDLEKCKVRARSLSLDLYSQWMDMEKGNGKWRFTSPTHAVKAFCRALEELDHEGGIRLRYERYYKSQKQLVEGMKKIGFTPLLSEHLQSPIITSFFYPEDVPFKFKDMYDFLKAKGFIIYPGKVSKTDSFRIGNIGEIYEDNIENLLHVVKHFYTSIDKRSDELSEAVSE